MWGRFRCEDGLLLCVFSHECASILEIVPLALSPPRRNSLFQPLIEVGLGVFGYVITGRWGE
jgi:hypothetical protein